MGCNPDSPNSPNSPSQFKGQKAGESGGELNTRGELNAELASQPESPNSPQNTALTRDDEPASQASQKYPQSLAGEERASVPRCACDNEMVSPTSVARGHCERCHLAANNDPAVTAY